MLRWYFKFVPEGHSVVSKNIIAAANSIGLQHRIFSVEHVVNNKVVTNSINTDVLNVPFSSIQNNSLLFFLSDLVGASIAISKSSISNCDILHLLNLPKELYGSFLRFKKPYLVCHLYHSIIPSSHKGLYGIRRLALQTRFFSRLFRGIICSSNIMTKQLTALGYQNVFFLPFPVDTNRFNKVSSTNFCAQYPQLHGAYVIAYVGRLHPSRGIFDLLQAFSLVLKRNSNTYLLIAYPELNVERYFIEVLKEMIKSLGIGEKVILLANIAEIEMVYKNANLVVLPFRTAHFYTDPPLVVLEAMASGTPVITTKSGAISDIVDDEKSGIIVEQGDIINLAEKISVNLENQGKIRQIGENAREKMEKEFSFEVVGKKLESIYERVLNDKK